MKGGYPRDYTWSTQDQYDGERGFAFELRVAEFLMGVIREAAG